MWTTWSHAVVVGGSVVVVVDRVEVVVEVVVELEVEVDVVVLELVVEDDSDDSVAWGSVDVVAVVAVIDVLGVAVVAEAASVGVVVGDCVRTLDGAALAHAATQTVTAPAISDRARTTVSATCRPGARPTRARPLPPGGRRTRRDGR